MTLESLIPGIGIDQFFDLKDMIVEFEEMPVGNITGVPMNVKTDQPMKAKFEWEYKHDGLINKPQLFFQLLFERMGAGSDVDFPLVPMPVVLNVTPGGAWANAKEEVLVPANTLVEGVYKVVVLVKLGFEAHPGKTVLAAFNEVGMLNIYNPFP